MLMLIIDLVLLLAWLWACYEYHLLAKDRENLANEKLSVLRRYSFLTRAHSAQAADFRALQAEHRHLLSQVQKMCPEALRKRDDLGRYTGKRFK